MIRSNWKCALIGVVVAVVLSSAAPQADAQWWGAYRPVSWGCCYTSCYTPCYTTSCYSACCYDYGGWYLGWRPGPIRRLLFGRYKWYWGGGWSACCPSYDVCCATGCADCIGGGTVTAPATDQTPTPAKKPVAEPAMPQEPAATPEMPAPEAPAPEMPNTSETSIETSGVLTVWVPFDAKVTINGLQTRSTGSRRQFVSYGLKPGFSYNYVIKAQVIRDGQVQEDTKTVTLTAGQISAVAFGFNAVPEQVASVR